MSRILVVEDNADLGFALRTALEAEGHEVSIADSGPTGVRRAVEWIPDLVVLDIMLPGYDGYRALRLLREQGLDAPVLMLTARAEEEDKVRGFRLGADDYVTKPFGALELLARVDALLRRTRGAERREPVRDQVTRIGDIEVNRASRKVWRKGQPVALTPKEYELFLALLDREGAVAPRLELLRDIWGYQTDVSTRTVDIHVAELRRKLEEEPAQPRHIVTVWKVGYRLEP